MINFLKYAFLILFGFGSGLIISGAVFAFITVLGIVQRLAHKTKTESAIKIYEEAIIWGGIFGASTQLINYHIPIGNFITTFFSLCIGIFYGSLAVSLAETLDVIPILMRRISIKEGLSYFILAIALGKMFGSLIYYLIPGFYHL